MKASAIQVRVMNVRRSVWITLIVLLAFLAFLPLLLSQIIQYSLVSELERRGMTAITVDKLWLNPYTGVASIDALNFSKGKEDYHVTGLELDLRLTALLQRKVQVSGIRLVSANLVVQEDAEGNLLINGISLASEVTQEVVEDVVEDTVNAEMASSPQDTDSSATWQFALDSLGVEDVQVSVSLPNIVADVSIEKINIARLDTAKDHKADVELQLTLNRLALPASELETSMTVTVASAVALERLAAVDWLLSAETNITLTDWLLNNPQAAVKLPKTQLALGTAATYGQHLWTLAVQSQTQVADLEVTAGDAHLALPEGVLELNLEAKNEAGNTARAEQQLSAQTKLTLKDLAVDVAAADSSQTEDGKTDSSKTSVQLPQLVLEVNSTATGAEDNWQLTAQSKTVLSDLDVVSPQALVTWANAVLQLDGEATLKLAGDTAPDYEARLSLAADDGVVKKGAVTDSASETALMSLSQLSLSAAINSAEAGAVGDLITVENLLLSGLEILPSSAQPTLVSDAIFRLDGIAVRLPSDDQPLDVVVDRVAVPQATIRFVRDEQGQMPQLAVLSAEEPATAESSTTMSSAGNNKAEEKYEASKAAPVANNDVGTPLLIKQLSIGPDVVIHVSDAGTKPAFKEKVQFRKLQVENLSLQDKTLPAQLAMELQLSHDAAIKAEGHFNAVMPSADVTITLDEYQLLSLSGYSEQFTGYALEAGVFSLTSHVKVDDDQLDARNEAIINHVTLRPQHSATAERFAHSLTMPLDQALDLLRDRNDQIKLEVPVTGALNDPTVDLQKVINKALSGAVKKASMLVLKAMLQPYGALISVAQMAGETMTQVTLAPVQFAAGSAEMDSVAKDYAGKLAEMINDREALTLKLCGVSNRQDLQALLLESSTVAPNQAQQELQSAEILNQETLHQEALTLLASDRTDALKQYLHSELEVKSKQLLVCLPKYSAKANAISGVELSF